MAKKKAQHLYEILGQKAREVRDSAGAGHTDRSESPAQTPVPSAPAHRFVPEPPSVLQTPVPVVAGQEHVLENMITIRRDTAIVGALLVIGAIVVAFVLGRTSAPRVIEEKPITPRLGAPEILPEPGTSPAPAPDVGQQDEVAEESAEESAEAASPAETTPAPRPPGRVAIVLIAYTDSEANREKAKDVAEFVKGKGYDAEVVTWGSSLVIQVPGFESTDSARYKAAVRELSELEYRGSKPFGGAYPRILKR